MVPLVTFSASADPLHRPLARAVHLLGDELAILLGQRLRAEVGRERELQPLGIGGVALAECQLHNDGIDPQLRRHLQATVTDEHHVILVNERRQPFAPTELLHRLAQFGEVTLALASDVVGEHAGLGIERIAPGLRRDGLLLWICGFGSARRDARTKRICLQGSARYGPLPRMGAT